MSETIINPPSRNDRYSDVAFLVEATANEHQMLWERYAKDSISRPSQRSILNWESLSRGYLEHIADLDDNPKRPINLSIIVDKIENQLVLFYEVISRFVDHEIVEQWFKTHFSHVTYENNRLAHTNAMNFHIAIHWLTRGKK